MMKLGVNIDHVATLRQARGTVYPDPLDAAILCARAGAHGITAHLREDRRHVQDDDIFRLKELQPLPLNLEMANEESIIEIALSVRPAEVCLVPEKRQELTTDKPTVQCFAEAGIELSMFINADIETLDACHELGVPVVELHTGSYCDAEPNARAVHMEKLISAADHACSLGMRVNAGHGINLENLGGILCIPHLDTLNIGHSIVCRAVFHGLENAVKEMLEAMKEYNG